MIVTKRQRRNADIMSNRKTIARAWGRSYYGGNPTIILSELTTKKRKGLPSSAFVFPEDRKYPIHDESHARNALARVSQHGTPDEIRKVRAAVRRKFPNIKQS